MPWAPPHKTETARSVLPVLKGHSSQALSTRTRRLLRYFSLATQQPLLPAAETRRIRLQRSQTWRRPSAQPIYAHPQYLGMGEDVVECRPWMRLEEKPPTYSPTYIHNAPSTEEALDSLL